MRKDEGNLLCLKIKEMLLRKFEVCKKLITEKNIQLLHEVVLTDEDRDVDIGDNMPVTLSTLGNEVFMTTEDVEDIGEEDDFDSSKDTIESSIINCNRVLRFLQLLCENHHLGLQNFLREQKSEGVINSKTFDFVSNIAVMFGIYIKGFTNCYSSNLGDQLMSTLTEFIQGPCKENQTTIIN